MFAKNPVKRFAVVLSCLALTALLSLLVQLAETNRHYEQAVAHVQYLETRLGEAHERVLQLNAEKLARQEQAARSELLEFKNATFHKKFPDFARIVDTAFHKARRYGFNPNLVLSVIQVESNFNPLAVSPVGASGLMQVRYGVWKNEMQIDRQRLFDIDYNIDLGLRILRHYAQATGGDLQRALFHYNNGYSYGNTGYTAKVNSSIFNREYTEAANGVSQ